MLTLAIEQLRREIPVPLRLDNNVYMRRPPRPPVQKFQEFPAGPVAGDWVCCWSEAVKTELSISVCSEAASEVEIWLVVVLLLVCWGPCARYPAWRLVSAPLV